MNNLWTRAPGLLLEKIPKDLEEPNTFRKNRARKGEKALGSKAKGEERREKRGKQKLVSGERGGTWTHGGALHRGIKSPLYSPLYYTLILSAERRLRILSKSSDLSLQLTDNSFVVSFSALKKINTRLKRFYSSHCFYFLSFDYIYILSYFFKKINKFSYT